MRLAPFAPFAALARLTAVSIVPLLLALASAASAAPKPVRKPAPAPVAHDLCAKDEEVLLSCTRGARTMSVCQSGDPAASGAYIQYRFGRTGHPEDPPELEYPESKATPPSEAFQQINAHAGHWARTWLLFSRGGFDYYVFTVRNAYDVNGAGVVVQQGGKPVARLVCDGRTRVDHFVLAKEFSIPELQSALTGDEPFTPEDVLRAAGIRD